MLHNSSSYYRSILLFQELPQLQSSLTSPAEIKKVDGSTSNQHSSCFCVSIIGSPRAVLDLTILDFGSPESSLGLVISCYLKNPSHHISAKCKEQFDRQAALRRQRPSAFPTLPQAALFLRMMLPSIPATIGEIFCSCIVTGHRDQPAGDRTNCLGRVVLRVLTP